MRKGWLLLSGMLSLLNAACGNHELSTPIKTCRSVMQALAGNQIIVWHGEQQTEQKANQLVVNLNFKLQGQGPDAISMAQCIYGSSSQDADYRNTFGEYENTPSQLMINGKPIPRRDLMQAVNLATANTLNTLSQEAIQRGNTFIQWLNQRR